MDSKSNLNKIKAWIFLGLYFGLILVFGFKEVADFLLKYFTAETINKYLNLVINLFFLVLLIILFYKPLVNALKDFKNNFKFYIKKVFIFLGYVYLLNIICNIFLVSLGIVGSENNSVIIEMFKDNQIIVFVETCFLAPIVEETVFRGNLFSLIKGDKQNKIRLILAFLLSSMIFGLLHCHSFTLKDILANIPLIGVGFLLAKLYNDTNNIICNMLLHGIINTISMVILFLGSAFL